MKVTARLLGHDIRLPDRPHFQSRPEHGKWQAVNHHRDQGSDSDTVDPAEWNRASYSAHPIDSIEPIDLAPNGYREAALYHLRLMYTVDEFVTAAEDPRLAVVAAAVVLKWPSVHGLSFGNIAGQLGCSPATIARPCARFREMAGLPAGGFRLNPPGSNGDKAAAVQA